MAMVEFKFNIGDKVYFTGELLKPDVVWKAKVYSVETVVYSKDETRYSLVELAGFYPESRLVFPSEAKKIAISNCFKLMQQITGLKFEA